MFNTLNRLRMIRIICKLTKEAERLLYKENKTKETKELIKIIEQLDIFYDKNYKGVKN
ncbi:hypothetical protein [Clostridium botulinum]|uniref:hypothetical protein n=1 Tax=Clostridium botulinum TaxID=1491 RepID=UPI0003058034|nr:hypothetical protein [Clostridium botulinum]APC82249.1 hypothetical protein NPD12_3762 [Clostridium botulinum]MBY6773612.1 hypothetical protein [Clostridium botulinum]MBY6850353.1 hypothetical protein [Clostridium botulinum]MBY6857413.1 hypothetical protein [Clostridium botulinum]MBY6886068.1 hypothetical protein [Clostridium botulinum]